MQAELETIYREYLHHRKDIDSSKRKKIKNTLAGLIDREPEWYFSKLSSKACGIAENYGSLAASIPDGSRVESSEPSLAEAVISTRKLDILFDQFSEELLKISGVKAVLRMGSSTWSRNLDVRGGQTDPSDLDLELLIDPEKLERNWDFIPGFTQAIDTFLYYFEQNKVDYLSLSTTQDNVKISVHLMPISVFQTNCSLNVENIRNTIIAREFRVKPKSKNPTYHQRDVRGNLYAYECTPVAVEGGFITEIPVMITGENKQLILGLVMDKYFSYPEVIGDQDLFETSIKKFKTNLAFYVRKFGGKFSNLPSRRNRFRQSVLDQLDLEYEQILAN